MGIQSQKDITFVAIEQEHLRESGRKTFRIQFPREFKDDLQKLFNLNVYKIEDMVEDFLGQIFPVQDLTIPIFDGANNSMEVDVFSRDEEDD